MFQLSYNKLGYGLWVRLVQNLIEFDLPGIYEENRSARLVHLVKTSWHKLPDHVLFTHEVMVEEHVDLESTPPRYELAQVLNRFRLIKLGRNEEPSKNLARDNQLVDVI